MTNSENMESYMQEDVVQIYLQKPFLMKAEKYLLDKHVKSLREADFLDIGIGGGRTTYFLQNMVRTYTGVDFSDRFVTEVKRKYKGNRDVKILWADAREMKQFADESFDFILFSFNGIDCVPYEDRIKVLKECFRLLKRNGHFIFSFHNSLALKRLYSFQLPKNPFNWLREWKRTRVLKKINGHRKKYEGREYFSLYDGADYFKTEVLYINPGRQMNLLIEAGFSNVIFYGATTAAILPENTFSNIKMDWVYVDCNKE